MQRIARLAENGRINGCRTWIKMQRIGRDCREYLD
jgi:hypothetical protein